ncbi:putative NADH2 dehydrogenase 40K chain [Jaminaea rosea]|uniref:Putative NADH2 dehydrogenase 40K chain n=1 Tax=Jaminaea rosea TaxID=1569628 RepID=A0A316UK77_9BASI|nr:putative NADH2 dehydrogenase 40K chain [Jaminaea rosea]PWN24771.1 putative NADH2 dehydrogenase 40K chain [Jaminaea rosea]
MATLPLASATRAAAFCHRSGLASSSSVPSARRYAHDLVIKRKTGLPIQRAGPIGGGRSAVSGHVATVFGCTGFLGRYLVDKLGQKGTQVIVPYRDEDEKRHLKPLGDLGQIVPLEWDLKNDDQIRECLRHSDVVYNLTGRNYETKNFTFNDVHATGAARIAAIAADAGVSRFIHVSHLNAREDSPSKFLRSKAEGEKLVKQAFDGATIVRPGSLYGHEDRFLNQMARWPITWHVNYGRTKLRPTHSIDLARALELMMDAEVTSTGATFSLGGPKTYTITELLTLVESLTFEKTLRPGLNVPHWALRLAASITDKAAWWGMLSADEVDRRMVDDLPDEAGTKSWADLGMTPDKIEDVAIVYLRRYRSHLRFEQPVETSGTPLRKNGRYHVVD